MTPSGVARLGLKDGNGKDEKQFFFGTNVAGDLIYSIIFRISRHSSRSSFQWTPLEAKSDTCLHRCPFFLLTPKLTLGGFTQRVVLSIPQTQNPNHSTRSFSIKAFHFHWSTPFRRYMLHWIIIAWQGFHALHSVKYALEICWETERKGDILYKRISFLFSSFIRIFP